MRKNLTASISGAQALHGRLAMSRSVPGRKARWTFSTRRIQWMKALSSKRVRRTLDLEMAAEAGYIEKQVVPKPLAAAGIPVVVKGKGRREVARQERAFTSPSIGSLVRFEKRMAFDEFIEAKALARTM